MTLLDQFDGDIPEYINTDTEPLTCIHCGEEDKVDWGRLEADSGGVWRVVECLVCGTGWQELYGMAAIAHIKVGNKLGS